VSFPPEAIVVMMTAPVASPVLVVAVKAATVNGVTVTAEIGEIGEIVPVDFALIATQAPENGSLVTKAAQAAASTKSP
jgi:hypothetical protein